jgi:hypothetical protein
MKANKKAEMYAKIEKHGNDLNVIFNTGIDPVKLCKKLFSLENKAAALCLEECNTGKNNYVKICAISTQVKKILFKNCFNPELFKAVFINGDPRGYALKIKDDYVRENNLKIEKDWGGYGILAPNFTLNN